MNVVNDEALAAPHRSTWRSDVSTVELVAFSSWLAIECALALAAVLVLVHKAVVLAHGVRFGDGFLRDWALAWGGSMALVAIVAGAFVFRRTVSWRVILVWPWAVGLAVGLGYFLGVMGEMHPGSRFCRNVQDDPCTFSFGVPAIVLTLLSALVLGGLFVAVASLKRFVLRPRT